MLKIRIFVFMLIVVAVSLIYIQMDKDGLGYTIHNMGYHFDTLVFGPSTNNTNISAYTITDNHTIVSMMKSDVYKKCPEPDNWQTAKKDVCYVHSAHLHPDSNDTDCLVQILGALRQKERKEVNSAYRKAAFCRLWRWSSDREQPIISTARLHEIAIQSDGGRT